MADQERTPVRTPLLLLCPRCGHKQYFAPPQPTDKKGAYLCSVCQECGWTYYGPKEATP